MPAEVRVHDERDAPDESTQLRVDITIRNEVAEIRYEYAEDSHLDTVDVIAPDAETIGLETVPPVTEIDAANIREYRFDIRERKVEKLPPEFRREVRRCGYFPTFPVVREIGDGTYEVLDGHVRTATAKKLDLGRIPVHVLNVDDWGALKYWARWHFPLPGDTNVEAMGFYTEEERAKALERILGVFDEQRLREVEQFDYALDELDGR